MPWPGSRRLVSYTYTTRLRLSWPFGIYEPGFELLVAMWNMTLLCTLYTSRIRYRVWVFSFCCTLQPALSRSSCIWEEFSRIGIFMQWCPLCHQLWKAITGHNFFSRNIRIMIFFVCFLHLYASNLSYLEALYYFFFKSENKLENQIFLEYFFHQFFYDF
jgi:hypothetical protein